MRFYHTLASAGVFLLIFLFGSCAYRQNQLLFQQEARIDSTLRSHSDGGSGTSDYRIRSQDILQVRNLQNPRYIVDQLPSAATTGGGQGSAGSADGQSYQVDDEGNVALPLIGRVQVAGLTRMEAQKKIEAIFAKDVLVNPIIDLKITNLKVTVMGEVRVQGNYPLVRDKTNLVEIIGEAGGLTDKGDEKTVKIIRGDPAHPQVVVFDLSQVRTLADPRMVLKNNDIIYVAQNKRAIKNDQLQSVTTTIQPALIILNTALIIYTLIRR
jgi:polysaccharide export outer membrane protein